MDYTYWLPWPHRDLSHAGLDNDMSLPKNHADFTVFEVFGQVSSKINVNSCTVNIVLGEDVYVNDLHIKTVQFSEGTQLPGPCHCGGEGDRLDVPVSGDIVRIPGFQVDDFCGAAPWSVM